MSEQRYHQVTDGESYYEDQGFNYEQCCDCGLVHRVRYEVHDSGGKRIKNARVHLTVWRVKSQTKLARQRKLKKAIVVLP